MIMSALTRSGRVIATRAEMLPPMELPASDSLGVDEQLASDRRQLRDRHPRLP